MGSDSSAEVILDAVTYERTAKLTLLETIDSRAGVLLGFAAALTALAPVGVNLLVEVGRGGAVLGGIAALATFWPRDHGSLDVDGLSDFARADIVFTRLNVFLAQAEIVQALTHLVMTKARRLRVAMFFVGAAALSMATGLALH
jgi:hypothetical protein